MRWISSPINLQLATGPATARGSCTYIREKLDYPIYPPPSPSCIESPNKRMKKNVRTCPLLSSSRVVVAAASCLVLVEVYGPSYIWANSRPPPPAVLIAAHAPPTTWSYRQNPLIMLAHKIENCSIHCVLSCTHPSNENSHDQVLHTSDQRIWHAIRRRKASSATKRQARLWCPSGCMVLSGG